MSKDSGKFAANTTEDSTELIVVQVGTPHPAEPSSSPTRAATHSTNTATQPVELAAHPHHAQAGRAMPQTPTQSPSQPPFEMPAPAADVDTDEDDEIYRQPLAPGSRAFMSNLHLRVFPNASERLSDVDDLVADQDNSALHPVSVAPHVVLEVGRETLACHELLRTFRQRLILTSSLGLILLPLFTLIFAYLSPITSAGIIRTHLCLMLLCFGVRAVAPRIHSLLWARMVALTSYTLFSMGSAVVIAQISQDPLMGHNQIIAYAGHNQMMLSTLLLPFSAWESLVVMLIAIGTLVWSTWWTAAAGPNDFYLSQLFVFETTALFVVFIARFQTILRRQAFDATYELAHSAAQSQKLSTADQLTGGYNRHYLEKALTQEIARAARFTHPLSVIMFDLDNFKQVNDTRGHRAGDEVLREVWQIATSTVREIDSLARYGGDEFTVVLPETDETDAHAVAERLLFAAQAHLKQRFGPQHPASQVTLSIGLITLYLNAPIAVESVLEHADQYLYQAKRQGKNRIAIGILE